MKRDEATRYLQPPTLDPATAAAQRARAAAGRTADPVTARHLVSLGRFQLLGELGRGGMGRVLEAQDPELLRRVAVKVVIDPGQVTEAQLSRFVGEAQITSQLEHPNIIPVYEMGATEQGHLYFVMKKVQGQSLRQVIDGLRGGDAEGVATWSRHRLLTAFVQVCNAVAYAHARGVLHRDLKPDNVMLGRFGEVLVMDWGVARLVDAGPEEVTTERVETHAVVRTMDGSTIGTPGFMSPEQARGELETLDARSDVFALGAILYEILTWHPAWWDESVYALIYAAMTEPVIDPRVRAPTLAIPDDVAEICLRALAAERDERYASAVELAAAVEGFLEGSRRQERARHRLAEAEDAWRRRRLLQFERSELQRRVARLEQELAPWAPLEEKAELLAARKRLGAIELEETEAFEEVVSGCEQALSQDPASGPARSLLARAYLARFDDAELRGKKRERHYYARRVVQYDDGTHAAYLRGTGALTLRTDPPGAEVCCARFDTDGLVWAPGDEVLLGRTPLERVPLEMGSYLLTLRAPGRRDVRYPVHITRGRHWNSGPRPIPLLTDAQIGPGFVYVPAGPCIRGGDPDANDSFPRSEPDVPGFLIAELPVTMQEYCDFLNRILPHDPEGAWLRVPRQESPHKEGGGQYWDRPEPGEPFEVPEEDRDGDPWDPRWPVSAISFYDAEAYAEWRSLGDGRRYALPSELQWEKAARGVDGRIHPWGDEFDPTLCKMRESSPGRPQPMPVGSFPSDVSVYGVRDMAGSMRDWCSDPEYGGQADRRPMRGGSWGTYRGFCRCAYRIGRAPGGVLTLAGIRLVAELPE